MATLDDQITALETELEKLFQNGQETQSEHYRLKRARLKDLMDAKDRLEAKKIASTQSLGDRLRFNIPFRS